MVVIIRFLKRISERFTPFVGGGAPAIEVAVVLVVVVVFIVEVEVVVCSRVDL